MGILSFQRELKGVAMNQVPAYSSFLQGILDIQKISDTIDAISRRTLLCQIRIGSKYFEAGLKDKEEVLDYLNLCISQNFIPWVSIYGLD